MGAPVVRGDPRPAAGSVLGLLGLMWLPVVQAGVLDFEALAHGEIATTQFAASHGVTISAKNVGGGPDIAIGFDTSVTGSADPDLEGPPWSAGNLAPDATLGKLLIIAENDRGGDDGIVDSPDDEGSRPAGSLFFQFARRIDSIGFDLVDVEGPSEFGSDSGFVAVFYLGGAELARVGFGDFLDSSSAFYDPTVTFGDNSANRIAPITAAKLGVAFWDRVEINMGGSGGVDNLVWTEVPEPPVLASIAFGLIALRRRR